MIPIFIYLSSKLWTDFSFFCLKWVRWSSILAEIAKNKLVKRIIQLIFLVTFLVILFFHLAFASFWCHTLYYLHLHCRAPDFWKWMQMFDYIDSTH